MGGEIIGLGRVYAQKRNFRNRDMSSNSDLLYTEPGGGDDEDTGHSLR